MATRNWRPILHRRAEMVNYGQRGWRYSRPAAVAGRSPARPSGQEALSAVSSMRKLVLWPDTVSVPVNLMTTVWFGWPW